MKEGTVLFFDPYKGFGKIVDENGCAYFVGIDQLRDQINKGDKVYFTEEKKDDKKAALKVRFSTK